MPVTVEVCLRAKAPSNVELTGVPLVAVPFPVTVVPFDVPLILNVRELELLYRLLTAAFTGKVVVAGAAIGPGAVLPPPPPPQAANVAIALAANNHFKLLYMISLSMGKPTHNCAYRLFD